MPLTSKEIVEKFIEFYKERGHVQIPNVSLVPENDATLLFVNAGMFPLVPYIMGEVHPMGNKLVNVQRALRLEDIEEVGDNRHTTAFHMLGNWSLDAYFKEEQLNWVYEFIWNELGLDPMKTYSTVFSGKGSISKDKESVELLKKIFSEEGIEAKKGERIFAYEGNWWQRGDSVGELGGPDSEIFYYTGDASNNGLGLDLEQNENLFIEIGNSVFMQYVKASEGWSKMDRRNIDFGAGLERLAMVVQGKSDIFETDNFWPVIERLQELTGKPYKDSEEVTRHMRIIADHIRASVFLAMDGVTPSNKDQGYILRRLLRRIVRSGKSLELEKDISVELVGIVVEMFSWLYPDLPDQQSKIETLFAQEEEKFRRTLNKASGEVAKFLEGAEADLSVKDLAKQAFTFYQSLGYPQEIFIEDVRESGFEVDVTAFYAEFENLVEQHKQRSRAGAEKKFKGGLANEDETTIKYHTATHLLHEALRRVLGDKVAQEGSNITQERLRFDFTFTRKLTEEEISQVEAMVNAQITEGKPVNFEIMPKEKALETGALHFFGEKYGEKVKVYYVGDSLEKAYSKEFCGGPHVENTSELPPIEIYKQKKIGAKTVRIYAHF